MRLPTLTANNVIRTEKMFVKRTTIVKAAQMNNGTLEYALSGEEFIAKKAAKAKNMTIQLYLPPVLTLTWVGFYISLFENREDAGFRRNDRWGSCINPWVHACGADGLMGEGAKDSNNAEHCWNGAGGIAAFNPSNGLRV
jgi:hypothetical protein